MPSTLLHLKNYYDFTANTYVELGLTGMLGFNNRRGVPAEDGTLVDEPWRKTYAGGHRKDDREHHSQPRALFRAMSPAQQHLLFEITTRAMGEATKEIELRHVGNCAKADPAQGRRCGEGSRDGVRELSE